MRLTAKWSEKKGGRKLMSISEINLDLEWCAVNHMSSLEFRVLEMREKTGLAFFPRLALRMSVRPRSAIPFCNSWFPLLEYGMADDEVVSSIGLLTQL